MIGPADNLIMTWPQFAIYQFFYMDRQLAVEDLLDIWHGQPEERIPASRVAYVASYDIP